jgi:hypothetical protein
MPPHHVTRWSRATLEYLCELLPIELVRIEHEPLQPHNLDWYQATMEARFLPATKAFRWCYHRLGWRRFLRRYLESQMHTIHGHTILGVFRRLDR